MGYRLSQIAQRINGHVAGDANVDITGVAPLKQARAGDISFLASGKPEFLADLENSRASAVVVKDPAAAPGRDCIVVDDVVLAFDNVLAMFPTPLTPPTGVHPSAVIDPTARLGEGVCVGAGVVVQKDAVVGPRTVLWPNVFVGAACAIGADCVLYPGVVLREQTELGDRVTIHPNSTLGADGFGYRSDPKTGIHHKVPQVGRVVVGNDVEIGANSCIDRAKFGATRIGDGSKIDNLCQIAHNVQIGPGCLIAALAGIAGSTELEHHVVLAGHVGLRDNIKLGAGTIVTACSCVSQSCPAGSVLSGRIAKDHRTNMREMVLTARLPELFKRVDELIARLGTTASTKRPQVGE